MVATTGQRRAKVVLPEVHRSFWRKSRSDISGPKEVTEKLQTLEFQAELRACLETHKRQQGLTDEIMLSNWEPEMEDAQCNAVLGDEDEKVQARFLADEQVREMDVDDI